MTTFKQKRAINKIVENGGNVTKAMREAGYSENTVNNPSNLTRSNGYKEMLSESGLSDTLVISSLVEDIRLKPQNRTKELSLAIELLGLKRKSITEEIKEEKFSINLINYGSSELEKLSNEELVKIANIDNENTQK